MMRIFSARETEQALQYPAMLASMERLFAKGTVAPQRQHYTMPRAREKDAVLLVMPAWENGCGFGGVKIVTVLPDNQQRHLPTIAGSYLLFDETTGQHLALIEGSVLTARRTAAASVLGAKYLANPQANTLLVVGSGRVARELPAAFASQFPLQRILLWSRTNAKALALAKTWQEQGWPVEVCVDLAQAVAQADIISCATLSSEPLIQGQWLRSGQHIDLIGSFTPQMREADDECMRRARVYIDTPAALHESGDLVQPIASGVLTPAQIAGTLYDLCDMATPMHQAEGITVFKGVGHAVEDLACAIVAYQNVQSAA